MPRYEFAIASNADGGILRSGFPHIQDAWDYIHANNLDAFVTLVSSNNKES